MKEANWNWNNDKTTLFVDHATIGRQHLDDLRSVQMLTLWAVELEEPDLLTELPDLWWLGYRGGRKTELDWIGRLSSLKFLELWHAYALTSVDFLTDLQKLNGFHLHALPRVERLPSLAGSRELRHVELGLMKALANLDGLTVAPNLTALFITGRVGVTDANLAALREHPTLQTVTVIVEGPQAYYERWKVGTGKPRVAYTHREFWPFPGLSRAQLRTLESQRGRLSKQNSRT